MNDGFSRLAEWVAAGESMVTVAAGLLVASCFVIFNAARVLLYVPQIASCWRDDQGCPTISLCTWCTWCSWIVANASTGLYMWMFQGDVWGLILNLGNALMCGVTVAVTVIKRRRHATRTKLAT